MLLFHALSINKDSKYHFELNGLSLSTNLEKMAAEWEILWSLAGFGQAEDGLAVWQEYYQRMEEELCDRSS